MKDNIRLYIIIIFQTSQKIVNIPTRTIPTHIIKVLFVYNIIIHNKNW